MINEQLTLGERLRKKREEANLTQLELSKHLGYSNSVISRVEKNETLPTQEFIDMFIQLPILDLKESEIANILALYHGNPAMADWPLQAHWGDAPNLPHFFGRYKELTTLTNWLDDPSCRLVTVLGMGGMGKTALVAKVAKEKEKEKSFEYILWHSLRNAPPLSETLSDLLSILAREQGTTLPNDLEKAIGLILDYFSKHKCLLILDNMESILQGNKAGDYRDGYANYGRFLQRIGEGHHQSQLLITSREKPKEVGYMQGESLPVRVLALSGLDTTEGQHILQAKGLSSFETAGATVVAHYSGNPLALNLVAEMIREVYVGDLEAFVADSDLIFGRIGDVLKEQIARVSPLELSLLYWLAIEREPVPKETLLENLVKSESNKNVVIALRSLIRRSLVETNTDGNFMLQNVVMEYLTDVLVDLGSQELINELGPICREYAFMKATAPTYIRYTQKRLLVKPIADRLLRSESKASVTEKLIGFTKLLRESRLADVGYAGGNLLNLLLYLGCNLRGYDFSNLPLRQAFLQEANLVNVNFSGVDLIDTVFNSSLGGIESIAFHPDGELLAIGTSREIQVRHWQTGKVVFHQEGFKGWIRGLAFSPDGQLLASGSGDHTISLWDYQANELLDTWDGHSSRIRVVTFNPDGTLLASGADDRTVRIWRVPQGQCQFVLEGHGNIVNDVAFSPDGQLLASASSDFTVRLWQVATGTCTQILTKHTNFVRAVAFSPDGKVLASAGADNLIHLWDVASQRYLTSLAGHAGQIRSIAFSPDSSLLASGGHDLTVRVWEIKTGNCLHTFRGYDDLVTTLCFHKDSRFLATGSLNNTVSIHDVVTGQNMSTLSGYANVVWALCFGKDNQELFSTARRTIHRWDTISEKPMWSVSGGSTTVWALAASADGKTLASGGAKGAIVWDRQRGEPLRQIPRHLSTHEALAFNPRGDQLAIACNNRTVEIWDPYAGTSPLTFHGHKHRVRAVCFDSTGRLLASGSEVGEIIVWDVQTGQTLLSFKGHEIAVRDIIFNHDNSLLISCSDDKTIRIWQTQNGQSAKILDQHTAQVLTLASSKNKNRLISGSFDNTIRIWDLDNGQCTQLLQGHQNCIRTIALSPDEKIIASGSYDETIRLWYTDTGQCYQVLRMERPYEGLNITNVRGITSAQKTTLFALGAVINSPK
ncbi:MAG: helix-turn-helix domain-containing protein [Ardenticatenaceae bacterium]|nr:helix-turn-helix domain-containing protein [Ardenticatenaceae bacterium]